MEIISICIVVVLLVSIVHSARNNIRSSITTTDV